MNAYTWEHIHLGLAHDFEAVLSAEDATLFARLSGDTNPLHVDADYAQQAGFPGPVLFGMMTSSLYSQLVGVYLPGKYALLQGIDINFHNPCFAGETLRVAGSVSFLNEAYKRMEIKASIRRQDNTLVSKATIRVGFHAK